VSQLNRIGEAMNRKHGEKISVTGYERTEGEHIGKKPRESKKGNEGNTGESGKGGCGAGHWNKQQPGAT
jgi:hypothetical protein